MLNSSKDVEDEDATVERAYLRVFKSADVAARRLLLDKLIETCDSTDIAYMSERVDGFKRDFVCLLPLELVQKILGHLEWRDMLNCCSVSRLWNRNLSQSFNNMWLKFIVDNVPLNDSTTTATTTTSGQTANYKSSFVHLINRKTRLESGKLFRTSKIDLVDINAIGLYKNVICTATHIAKFWRFDEPVSHIAGADRTKYWLCFKTIQLISRAANLKFDDTYLLVSTYFLTVDIYSLATHQPLCQYVGHTCSITSFDFSQDLRLVVTGSADDSIKYWRIHDPVDEPAPASTSSPPQPHNSTSCSSLIMTESNLTWPVHISIHKYNSDRDEYLIAALLADGYIFLNLVTKDKGTNEVRVSNTFRSSMSIQTTEFNMNNANQNFFDDDTYENLLISNRSWIKMSRPDHVLTVYVVTENNSNQTKKMFMKRWRVDKCGEYDIFKIESVIPPSPSVTNDENDHGSRLAFLNKPSLKSLDIHRFEIITFGSSYCLFLDERNQFYLANLNERKIKCIQNELAVDAKTTVVFRLMMTNTQEHQFIFGSRDWLDGFKLASNAEGDANVEQIVNDDDSPFVWTFYSQKRNELFIVNWI